jgi:hypothetical protein
MKRSLLSIGIAAICLATFTSNCLEITGASGPYSLAQQGGEPITGKVAPTKSYKLTVINNTTLPTRIAIAYQDHKESSIVGAHSTKSFTVYLRDLQSVFIIVEETKHTNPSLRLQSMDQDRTVSVDQDQKSGNITVK